MSENASHKVFDGSALPGLHVLAERLIATACSLRIRLVTVESCTAGAMAHALSRPFGAALALAGGFVTYTKAAKEKLVGVPRPLLAECTAVHAEVAKAMTLGALERSGADCAIAITGVTGAEPDEDGNPIGRVVVGFARAGETRTLHCEFGPLAPDALAHLAIQAAIAFGLSQLGDEAAHTALNKALAC
ncbi:CinA family protein [Bosea sp. TAF32]|uniref:CinA family protein n=1 Tax=Bosea sp. TAF32 TaxID=3237482 RepID=UPI003F92B414